MSSASVDAPATDETAADETDEPWDEERLQRLPMLVPLSTAGEALGWGYYKSYGLAKRDEFPVPLEQIGRHKYCKRADLIRYVVPGAAAS
ncbi:hypothetical protein [Cryptosporangium sp. NPDC051539]|uniref:hypothetical protein n=1 Tax=Cryptosporangium sp. NPDC051539 TaxID=3363962 RepID=UPI0037BC26B4